MVFSILFYFFNKKHSFDFFYLVNSYSFIILFKFLFYYIYILNSSSILYPSYLFIFIVIFNNLFNYSTLPSNYLLYLFNLSFYLFIFSISLRKLSNYSLNIRKYSSFTPLLVLLQFSLLLFFLLAVYFCSF